MSQSASVPSPDDTVSIVVAGIMLSGWITQRITRGVERCPADFDLEVTERYPTDPTSISIVPGDACQIMIGTNSIMSGYVDRYSASISARSHSIRISGRSKCADLVDCSALVKNSQIGQCTPISLAQQLASPFSITVAGNITAPQLPPFSVTLGETPFEIIENVARYAGCLVYDQPDGSLIMTPVGTSRHASGFSEGVNVESASVSFSMDERFSRYIAVMFSSQNLNEFGNSGNLLGEADDTTVPRFRPLIIVSEQYVQGQSIAQKRAVWERQRRFGRSQQVVIVCDGWRDSAGALWTPNMLAPINLPSLKLPAGTSWIITEVTFAKDAQNGTQAIVTLMPPEALTVEPTVLQAYDWQAQQAQAGQAPPS